MSKEDLARFEGKITDATGGGQYIVTLDNGVKVSTKLCGKMKRFNIRVIVGDRVTVGVSPYDPTHGFILHRYRI